MEIKDLSKPLPISSIDFRVQSINKVGYATILAYKDARIDMTRLDDVVGALNWKREHTRDNHNCIVSIYNTETKEWVSKEDTGTESNTEKEKGLASDSFKRACFNWGIGRELYDYPNIQIKLNANEFKIENYNGKEVVKPTFSFRLKEWIWESDFDNNTLVFLRAIDDKGNERFVYNKNKKQPKPQQTIEQPQQPKTKKDISVENFKKLLSYTDVLVLEKAKIGYNLTNEQIVTLEEKIKTLKDVR